MAKPWGHNLVEKLIAAGDYEKARDLAKEMWAKYHTDWNIIDDTWHIIDDTWLPKYLDCERRVEERRRGVLGKGAPEEPGTTTPPPTLSLDDIDKQTLKVLGREGTLKLCDLMRMVQPKLEESVYRKRLKRLACAKRIGRDGRGRYWPIPDS